MAGYLFERETEEDAIAAVRYSLNMGINFIDTAYAYGTSEERVGKAISRCKRKPFIATKTSADKADITASLERSLKSLGVESIDLYQFHNVSNLKMLKDILTPGGGLSILKEAQKKGQIKHIGISSHQLDVAKEIVKTGEFETIMYPFNFVTCEGIELLELARQQDVGFIAMKPFAGGRIKNIAVAIKYLLQFPDVLVLPGIGNTEQAVQILDVLKTPQMMPEEEQEMQTIREEMDRRFCRHCDYCLPCPQGIPVSMVLDFEPLFGSFPEESFYTGDRGEMMITAEKCDNCGECEKKCPYGITIRALITEYVKKYGEGRKKYLPEKS